MTISWVNAALIYLAILNYFNYNNIQLQLQSWVHISCSLLLLHSAGLADSYQALMDLMETWKCLAKQIKNVQK